MSELLQWVLDTGGLAVAIAVLWWQNRELSKKLDDCYSEICEELEAARVLLSGDPQTQQPRPVGQKRKRVIHS